MAADWIKFRKSLVRDGRVVSTARKCHAERVTVIGALVTLWCLGDDYCDENGALHGYTKDDLEREIGVPGFLDALPPDWFSILGETPQLPSYQQHNGETAKIRALAVERKRRERKCHAPTVTRDRDRDREEKRRGRPPKTPLAPPLSIQDLIDELPGDPDP